MTSQIPSVVDNSLGASGWLELKSADVGDLRYIIPGTTMNYKCNDGFSLPDGTNPDQKLHCQGNRKVNYGQLLPCERKE